MKVSVCIATYNKSEKVLTQVLGSIVQQVETLAPTELEVIVVDDGSSTSAAYRACAKFFTQVDLRYFRLSGPAEFTNPSKARNWAYMQATGEIIICQSDDVVHASPLTILRLVTELREGEFVLATVINTDAEGKPTPCLHPRAPKLTTFVSPGNPRPLFFLGAVWRKDLYAVGGNEELFTAPGRDDMYFSQCLIKGLGLTYRVLPDAVGHHLHHSRPADTSRQCRPSDQLYQRLAAEGRWVASGGPWEMEEEEPQEILPPAAPRSPPRRGGLARSGPR